MHQQVGFYCGEGPPVPFPNTEVKLTCADNTRLETAREDMTKPTQIEKPPYIWWFFASRGEGGRPYFTCSTNYGIIREDSRGRTAMGEREFYRRWLRGNILYYSLLGLFGVFSIVGLLLSFVFGPVSPGGIVEELVVSSIHIGVFVLLIWFGRFRKKLYQNFLQLSNAEQAEIKSELSAKFKHVLFGVNRIYFSPFLSYVNYRDIVWIYSSSTSIPFAVPNGDIIMESSTPINAAGLMLWSRDGKRYKIPMGLNTWKIDETIAYIKERQPNVLIGFNKNRLKLAKKDFDRFLIEGKSL